MVSEFLEELEGLLFTHNASLSFDVAEFDDGSESTSERIVIDIGGEEVFSVYGRDLDCYDLREQGVRKNGNE